MISGCHKIFCPDILHNMKLTYKSTFYKITSVFRYLVARAFYLKKFQCNQLSMIGKRCGIHIFKSGNINCAGRIIVNNDVLLFSKGTLNIGTQFGINSYSRIVAHNQINIGNNVTIGQFVSILDHDHKYGFEGENLQLNGYTTAPIIIGNNVWIADKCTILKGVTIGNNVIIGANTLVNKDVPDNVVFAGSPGRILKNLKNN